MNQLDEAEANFVRAKLQGFLSRNPEAEVRIEDSEPSIERPWGDEAIAIPLRSDDEELFEALNAVRLPPRFTAIWHEDNKELEIIYTVLNSEDHLLERKFEFRYEGHTYRCFFAESSSRLRTIAEKARPTGIAPLTDFRNLQPFYRFERMLKEIPHAHFVSQQRPTSFWIQGIDSYDDGHVANLARSLNFYMAYFDRQTPTILIHEEPTTPSNVDTEYGPDDSTFPETIVGQDIDQHLLILWASAQRGDPFLRFIQYYQILEYAGFYHVRDQVRREIERAITAPDVVSRSDRVAQQIIDAISADRRQDDTKINAMIEDCVDIREMWDVMEQMLETFSDDSEFEGGFTLPAIVGKSISYEEFAQSWHKQFLPALHKIRNALVHARELRQSTTIAPTIANRARLAPWLVPLSHTAARVMLYSRF